jgi:hypothetical protein
MEGWVFKIARINVRSEQVTRRGLCGGMSGDMGDEEARAMQVLYIYIYIYIYIFNMCMVQSESIYMHIRSTFTNNKIQIYNAFDADCMPVCAVYVRVCPHTHNMRTRIHIHTHTRTHTHIIHTVRVYKNESWAHL